MKRIISGAIAVALMAKTEAAEIVDNNSEQFVGDITLPPGQEVTHLFSNNAITTPESSNQQPRLSLTPSGANTSLSTSPSAFEVFRSFVSPSAFSQYSGSPSPWDRFQAQSPPPTRAAPPKPLQSSGSSLPPPSQFS